MGAQAERLLKDPRAKAGAREFYRQWLDVDPILTRTKDAEAYPTFSPALLKSMHEETMRVLEEHAASERPFLEVLAADHTWVDGRLDHREDDLLLEADVVLEKSCDPLHRLR